MFGMFGGAGAGAAAASSTMSARDGVASPVGAPTSDAAASAGGGAAAQLELATLLPQGWEGSDNFFVKTAGTLLSNPYFSAGAGLWVLTVGGKVGNEAMGLMRTLLRRRFVVSMEIVSTDSAYDWMIRWLASQSAFHTQQTTVQTRVNYSNNDSKKTNTFFAPCPGVQHYFFYEGRPLKLLRKRTENARSYDGDVFETLQFTTYGLSTKPLERIMEAAKAMEMESENTKTVIYINGGGRWTRQSDPRRRRPLESVIFPDGIAEELLRDVRLFLASSEFYQNLGVPYRRGYLLHGPPGCGKTSFVMAVAGELGIPICLLSLSTRGLTDENLMSLLNNAQQNSIVLMEDIDRAFTNESSVTMSGVLNALDGVGAQEGRLVFMTTNHVEKLDAALIRPGRADVKVEIGLMTETQVIRMFTKFFPEAPVSLQKAFAGKIAANTMSCAALQSHLFFHRDDPQKALDALDDFLQGNKQFDALVQEKREKEMEAVARMQRPPILNL